MASGVCAHIDAVTDVKHARARRCEECVKIDARWVHLRTCQSCGTTLCCDSSPNQHATKHARASKHPVVASAEPGERWLYCYPDDQMAEYTITHSCTLEQEIRRAGEILVKTQELLIS